MSQYTGRPEDPTRGRSADDTDGDLDDDTLDDDYDDEPRGFGATLFAGIKELVIVVVLAMALSFVVKTWLFQAFYIPSGSMENTLVKDDRVIVSKLTPNPVHLQRGDIVVFQDPDHWLPQVPSPYDAPGFGNPIALTMARRAGSRAIRGLRLPARGASVTVPPTM